MVVVGWWWVGGRDCRRTAEDVGDDGEGPRVRDVLVHRRVAVDVLRAAQQRVEQLPLPAALLLQRRVPRVLQEPVGRRVHLGALLRAERVDHHEAVLRVELAGLAELRARVEDGRLDVVRGRAVGPPDPEPLTKEPLLASQACTQCNATKDNRRAIINTALDAEAILRAGALL